MISKKFCLLVHFTCFSNQSPENGVCPYCVADEKEFNREHDWRHYNRIVSIFWLNVFVTIF